MLVRCFVLFFTVFQILPVKAEIISLNCAFVKSSGTSFGTRDNLYVTVDTNENSVVMTTGSDRGGVRMKNVRNSDNEITFDDRDVPLFSSYKIDRSDGSLVNIFGPPFLGKNYYYYQCTKSRRAF